MNMLIVGMMIKRQFISCDLSLKIHLELELNGVNETLDPTVVTKIKGGVIEIQVIALNIFNRNHKCKVYTENA